MLPTPSDILALHKKYAPNSLAYDLVYTHSCIIRDIALQLIDAGNPTTDRGLVVAGAMLHDIGVYPLFRPDDENLAGAHFKAHGIAGERLLKAEGIPERLWRFTSHHTGVGLAKQDVIDQKLPMPIADYFAETDEELLIMYADKFHSKTTPPYFNSYEWYRKDIQRFGEDKVVRFDRIAQKFGVPDLIALTRKYPFEIR